MTNNTAEATETKKTKWELEEQGIYTRKVLREGKKTKTETTRIRINEGKVNIGSIGGMSAYVYPYSYPNYVFLGKFPFTTKIKKTNVHEFITTMNRCKWYLDGNWENGNQTRREVRELAQKIQNAYNYTLKQKIDVSK